jgi:hypothetical protein
MRDSYHKCFGAAQFAVFGHRSDQQGMKVTEPFRVGTETPAPPFASKAVIVSTLCVWIVVSAPFLRWPGTDRPSEHRAELHNASVDEASKLDKTNNSYLEHYIRFLLRFRVFLRPCFAYPTRTGQKGDTRLLACLHFFA